MRTRVLLAAALLLLALPALLGPGLARAQQAAIPRGSDVALGLPTKCPSRARQIVVRDPGQRGILGRWVAVEGPGFGTRPGTAKRVITAHAVAAHDPRVAYATDGSVVERTRDAGCSWTEVFRLDEPAQALLPGSDGADSIAQIVVPDVPGAERTAYLVVLPLGGAGRVQILATEDGGDTWTNRSRGLPPASVVSPAQEEVCGCFGIPGVLAAAPGHRDRLYLALAPLNASSGIVYATTDGGASWQPRGGPAAAEVAGGGTRELVVDPGDPETVWLLSNALHRSSDGGRTWPPVAVDGELAGVHLAQRSGGAAVVQVLRREPGERVTAYPALLRSVDGGESFTPLPLDPPLQGQPTASPAGAADALVLGTTVPEGAYRWNPAARRLDRFDAPDLPAGLAAPQIDRTLAPAVWFRTAFGMAAYVAGSTSTTGLRRPSFPAPNPLAPVPPSLLSGTLTPGQTRIDLEAEGERVQHYDLALPELPTPVDVWFLVDTSGSMDRAIEGLREGLERIVAGLQKAGFDARFGLAEYKGEFGNGPYRYLRLADLAPPGTALEQGLARLRAVGGGEETQYQALYESVTGRGDPEVGIQPGQQASFRPDALKIIVHATDEVFGNVPDGPTRDQTVAALNSIGVRHFGLDFSAGTTSGTLTTNPRPARTTRQDLDDMARATGTFAPAGGVDCNGDGTTDLRGGDPLTCAINRSTEQADLVSPIVTAVEAVRDDTVVALGVADAGGLEIEVVDAERTDVNLKSPNRLGFDVRYRCPRELTGREGRARLVATVRGAPAASALADVGCGAPPPRVVIAPPLVAAVAVAPAPPQVVPQIESAPAPVQEPSPVPGSASQPAAVPGMAAEPAELETVKVRTGHRGGDDGTPGPEGAAGLLAGSALALGLGGWAARRQDRTAQQRHRSGG